MKKICTICARGGSKGVKNKNLRHLLGKPLIAHSIQQAIDSGEFDLVVVSSDSAEILKAAQKYGANAIVERPDYLATDKAAKIPAIQHCVKTIENRLGFEFDIIVDLDATSPLRSRLDIAKAIQLLIESKAQNIITACEARRSPYFNLVELDHEGKARLSKVLENTIIRRQDSPKCYDMNASIYVWNRESLFESEKLFKENTRLYEMPIERSIDIDTELDFEIVEFIMKKHVELAGLNIS
jgi:CMP-N,N'-diacetyllegionaminic acid synthase